MLFIKNGDFMRPDVCHLLCTAGRYSRVRANGLRFLMWSHEEMRS